MSNIAFLPIDNRPVCYQLPKMIIAQAKEHSIFLPDINLLGDLTKPADISGLFNWVNNLDNIDIFILSLDTIAYGGLIPSRKSSESFNSIVDRIDKLFEILLRQDANVLQTPTQPLPLEGGGQGGGEKNTSELIAGVIKETKSKIYAFSSIMRISNNNINEEEKEYWKDYGKKIFEYSYYFHKEGKTKNDIPKNILNDYLETRKRNFEINKYYIELKQKGFIDTLVFSKDDCSEYGLNVIEAEELKKLSDNIIIKTGADEIPLTLLSRAINKEKNIKIYPVYTEKNYVNQISNYEDISVKKSVEEQIEISGGIISDENNCDMVLLVNNFKSKQGELVMGIDTPLFDGELNLPDKPFFVADIRNANGSDNNFVEKLLKTKLNNFYGYAAWNTTGNTLGSTLACALTHFKAKKPDIKAFNELQTIRFLDDWAYQANVRGKIKDNTVNLTNNIVKTEMKKYEKIIKEKFSVSKKIDYYYPWNRFFEIGIKNF